jgi:hypothetical protein
VLACFAGSGTRGVVTLELGGRSSASSCRSTYAAAAAERRG